MRRIGLLGVGVAALALTFGPSAQAAQYGIKASNPFVGRGVTVNAFKTNPGVSACNTSVLPSVNGIDAYILPVPSTWIPGTRIRIKYSGAAVNATSNLIPTFFVQSTCNVIPSVFTSGGAAGADLVVQVPAGVQWLALEAINTADITITI